MIPTLAVDRFAARIPTLQPGHHYTCPNCRAQKFSLPAVVCASCQQEPTFKREVEDFNYRQWARRQERSA